MRTSRYLAILGPILVSCSASADYQLDINGGSNNYINSDLNTYSDGYNYPGGGIAVKLRLFPWVEVRP
jgi:hypothetical protein